MVNTIELTAGDFPASVDTTPIVRARYPARRYSLDGKGNLVIRQHKAQDASHLQGTSADLVPQRDSMGTEPGSILSRDALTEAISALLGATSLARAAVAPMARTLSALAGDATVFDRTVEAQLNVIDLPSTAVRSVLLEAIRNVARLSKRGSTPQPIVEYLTRDIPEMRISGAHERPFTSISGSGATRWRTVIQEEQIPHPPESLKCKTGDLFQHINPTTKSLKCWMCGRNGKWVLVEEGTEHPFISDRVLHFRHNGDPSWNTRATMTTRKARKEKRLPPGPSV